MHLSAKLNPHLWLRQSMRCHAANCELFTSLHWSADCKSKSDKSGVTFVLLLSLFHWWIEIEKRLRSCVSSTVCDIPTWLSVYVWCIRCVATVSAITCLHSLWRIHGCSFWTREKYSASCCRQEVLYQAANWDLFSENFCSQLRGGWPIFSACCLFVVRFLDWSRGTSP